MKVKICGITRLIDAQYACKLGAWALGFNFYPSSKRYISPQSAQDIIAYLPTTVCKIGIFVDVDLNTILATKALLKLDYVQVYNDYAQQDIDSSGMIYALSDPEEQPQKAAAYPYMLIDAPRSKTGFWGGSGQCADWQFATYLKARSKLILAGGLHPGNVAQAIRSVKPYGIDVASGIETAPGIKNHLLMKAFFDEVKHART